MSVVSPIPIAVAILLALATAFVLSKWSKVVLPSGRVSTIDGLRGYLGFSVFLHHACIWYFFLQTGKWQLPPSNLYTHLGEASVALFFMITGFLFFSKLLDAKQYPVDWSRLYVSRFLRLTPLYLVAMTCMALLVALATEWELREPLATLLLSKLRWVTFAVTGAPNLNELRHTGIITAGVTWTLKYEWVFYMLLPALALLTAARVTFAYLLVSLSALVAIALLNLSWMLMGAFISGMGASLAARNPILRRFSGRSLPAFAVIGCVAVATSFPSAYGVVPLMFLTIAFTLVAAGNTLFGILTNDVSRFFGEMTYSIYLLHGLVLFVVFRFGLGYPVAANLSPIEYWGVIFACTPVLIIISFFTYSAIEMPAMHLTSAVMARLRMKTQFPLKW